MGRGVTGGDRGETAGDRERPGAQHYQQFLLIVQLVAGNTLTMLNPQLVARKNVFFGDHES